LFPYDNTASRQTRRHWNSFFISLFCAGICRKLFGSRSHKKRANSIKPFFQYLKMQCAIWGTRWRSR